MAKNVKNIGIDLGNSTICVAGIGSDGNRMTCKNESWFKNTL